MPKVSVIIPSFNREKLIGRAIDSVLAQTFADFEVIIIDDGSKDHTRDIVSAYNDSKIRYFYQDNQGVSAARNRGIHEARGKYIAFLDSDDSWMPQKLALQVDILDRDPQIGIVYHKLIILDEKGEAAGFKPSGENGRSFKELVEKMGDLPTSSLVTKKECFEKAGLFDQMLPPMEDYEMWLRIAYRYDICEVPQALAYYYRHDNQLTKNMPKVYSALVAFDKKILRIFPDVPRRSIAKRLSQNQYTLSRIYFDQGRYAMALSDAFEAIARDPLVGLSFADKTESAPSKVFKIFKTYAYLLISAFKAVSTSHEKHPIY